MQTTLKIGDTVEAEVTSITECGAFVRINGRDLGLIHISQISNSFVKDVNQHLKVGDKLKARVIKLGPGNKIDLTLKSASAVHPAKNNSGLVATHSAGRAGFKSSDFEEKLKRFLEDSRKTTVDLKKHSEKYY